MRLRNLTVAFAALVFFVEIWAVVPAPTIPLLALAVIVPEVAPWGVLVSLASLSLVLRFARGRARGVATVLASSAILCAAYPLVLIPATTGAADRAMRALQPVSPAKIALEAASQGTMLHRPFDLRLAVTGFETPGDVFVRYDLPVVTRDKARLALDVYRRAGEHARPAIVLIYGGAWIFGSRGDMAEIARSFAHVGYTVIVIDYRHAPAFHFPTQRSDVEDALGTIARNAREWRVDPDRVALFGCSAGAELALLAAYRPQPLRIRAVVAYYAPTDLTAGYVYPPVPDPSDVRAILRNYLGGTLAQRPAAYREASPVLSVREHLPPTFLIGGARDELIRLSLQRELRDALRRSSNTVVSIELPWSNHVFDTIPSGLGGQIARYYTQRFLRAVL